MYIGGKQMKKRYLFIILIILSIISLFVGVTNISVNDILSFNIDKIQILLISRFPRLIAIIVAGVGLSISGLIMQQISKNKFVSPTTAATADFAKLGILFCIMIIPGATIMQKMIISFIFAGLGTILFMKMIKAIKIKNIIFVPLIGMMLGKIIGSITTFFAYKYDLVQNISSWMEGDMSLIMKGSYELLYLSIPMVIIAFLYANKFTIVGMGEDFAINLGVNYNFVVNVGLAIVSLICAVTIITVGNIPFLGLIIPNIISLYSGDNLKKTLYHTALLGPIFLLACDILGRFIIFPFEMSISLTVGVIGSIIFLYMIIRGSKNEG
jgi:iron complex transport system permease protein